MYVGCKYKDGYRLPWMYRFPVIVSPVFLTAPRLLQALEALRRFYAGEKRFFDMTDAGAPVQWTADSAAAVYMAAGAAVVVAAGIVIVRKGRGSHE